MVGSGPELIDSSLRVRLGRDLKILEEVTFQSLKDVESFFGREENQRIFQMMGYQWAQVIDACMKIHQYYERKENLLVRAQAVERLLNPQLQTRSEDLIRFKVEVVDPNDHVMGAFEVQRSQFIDALEYAQSFCRNFFFGKVVKGLRFSIHDGVDFRPLDDLVTLSERERTSSRGPPRPSDLLRTAREARRKGQHVQALEYFERAFEALPSPSLEDLTQAAKSAVECHRWAAAEDLANRILLKEPRNLGALAIKGLIYTNWQCHDRAVLFWQSLLKANPTDEFVRKSYQQAKAAAMKGLHEKNLSLETLCFLQAPKEERRQWERKPCQWPLIVKSLREERKLKLLMTVVSAGGARVEGSGLEFLPKRFHFFIALPNHSFVTGIGEKAEGVLSNACGVKFALMSPEDRELLNTAVLALPKS